MIEKKDDFKHGLLNCCDDCGLCCMACCFPCCTIGSIKKKMGLDGCCGTFIFKKKHAFVFQFFHKLYYAWLEEK